MKYAPITIPTLCRYTHFVRCVESLKKNTWAKYTDVFIGLDYPKKESHRDGYLKIKEYLQGDFSEFHSFTVIAQKKNVGARKNAVILREECFRQYDRYIYSEDDMEYSPNFIQYMDETLDKYENDDSVVAVTAYSYPVQWKVADGSTVVKQNFICSAWGRGFWREKREAAYKYLSRYGLSRDFPKAYQTGCFDSMLEPAVIEYTNSVAYGWSTPRSFINSTTDVAMRIYLAVKKKYTIMPVVSKVRNHGFDGSGVYCQSIAFDSSLKQTANNYPFHLQPIDTADTFELIEDTAFDIDANRRILNEFENASPEKIAAALKKAEEYSRRGSVYGILLGIKNAFCRPFHMLTRYLKR